MTEGDPEGDFDDERDELDDDGFDDGDDDFEGPLPQEDRIWRHPSELAGAPPPTEPPPLASFTSEHRRSRRDGWAIAAGSAAVGAAVSAAILLSIGVLRDDGGSVIERHVAPITDLDPSAVAESVLPAVVRLEVAGPAGVSIGSGVVYRDDGHVLTTATLLQDADQVTAFTSDGRSVPATIVGADPASDIGVVRVDVDTPVAAMGPADELEKGEAVIVVSPSLTPGSGPLIARAVVAELDLRVEADSDVELHEMVQLSGDIGELPPGAVVVSQTGAVVGIANRVEGADAAEGDPELVNFATPIDFAHRVAGEIIEWGHARHPWLGIEGGDRADQEIRGAIVEAVDPESPAQEVGLAPEDVIISVNGVRIENMDDLAVELREATPGDVVEIEYVHDGELESAWPTLAEEPPTPEAPPAAPTTTP